MIASDGRKIVKSFVKDCADPINGPRNQLHTAKENSERTAW
jgi:hypothetical protein